MNSKASVEAAAPRVSVVLVSWNTITYLQPCLHSIFAANTPSWVEAIVVDNGSSDGTQELLHENWPWVRLIENEHNRGFADATNQGVREAKGEYVLLLNPDTLLAADALGRLVAFLDATPQAAAAGGRLLNMDGSFQSSFADFPSLGQEMLIASGIGDRLWPGYPSHRSAQAAQPVDWITGACLLVRRQVYEQLGGFDSRFVMYSEEVDLQYHIQRSGKQVYYLPEVTTLHHGGGSQGRLRRRRMVYRGKLLFFLKNYGLLRQSALRLVLAGTALGKMFVWSAGWCLRSLRGRAAAEIRSNLEVLELCWAVGRKA